MSRLSSNLNKYLNHIFFVYTEASLAVISLVGMIIECVCFFVIDAFWQPFALVGVCFFALSLFANIRIIVREERKWMTRTRIFQ
jgi:hypothetical protein